jgi:endonuclease YncB( thermonuclease family)
MRIINGILISFFLISLLASINTTYSIIENAYSVSGNFEINISTVVYKVVDGDTFDGFPIGRVRLADINTPERGEAGYAEAKQALADLTLNKRVYLDVDNVNVIDQYNRVVAVVYVRYNSTHLLNVNMWLLENGFAEVYDFDNEFDPAIWSLYVYMPINTLPESYEDLLSVYLGLNQSYNVLQNNYDDLNYNYNLLTEKYDSLNTDYSRLNSQYKVLEESYNALKENYNTLIMVLIVVVFGAGYILIRIKFRERRRELYKY